MKIKTRCDNCGKVYNMASEYIGRTAQCKRCGHHFIMNPYDPAAEDFPAQPQARTVQMSYQQPPQAAAYAPPPPVFNSQPAPAPAAGQHPMADQTILPNVAAQAQSYVTQTAQTPYQQAPQAAYAPQPGFQSRPAATPPLGGSTQTVLCLKCGNSFEIPVPDKKMKLSCQTCGGKITVLPENQQKTDRAPKAGGGSSGKSLFVLLLLILILILAGILFVGPMLLPDIFPDLIGSLLGEV